MSDALTPWCGCCGHLTAPGDPDPLTMNGTDYRNLPMEDKALSFGDWMCELLGTTDWREDAIDTLTLGEGYVVLREFVQRVPGQPIRHKGGWLTSERRLPCRRPPPVWKPLR